MAFAKSPSNSDIYSEHEQIKHYKLYLSLVPVMFCIILFMLLYMFYLKKQASTFSHPSPTFTRAPSLSSFVIPTGNLVDPIIIQRPPAPNQNVMTFHHSSGRRRHVVLEVGLKEDLKDKLPTIVFDEELKARDSLCSVCLGEFEMKEELIQLPSCKHIFHSDCICHWLSSTTTCPLCRCSVVVGDDSKLVPPPQPQSSPAVLLRSTDVATPHQYIRDP